MVSVVIIIVVQWDVREKDTLGLAILSPVGRLSSFRRLNVLTPCSSTLLEIWKVSFVERLSLSRRVL